MKDDAVYNEIKGNNIRLSLSVDFTCGNLPSERYHYQFEIGQKFSVIYRNNVLGG